MQCSRTSHVRSFCCKKMSGAKHSWGLNWNTVLHIVASSIEIHQSLCCLDTNLSMHELFLLFFKECTWVTVTGTYKLSFFISNIPWIFPKYKKIGNYTNLFLFLFPKRKTDAKIQRNPVICNHSCWYYQDALFTTLRTET